MKRQIGDVINGEHLGPLSTLPWAIRYARPDSLTPCHDIAYHPGGLYELVLGLLMFATLWPLRHRFRRPDCPSIDGRRALRRRPLRDVLLP